MRRRGPAAALAGSAAVALLLTLAGAGGAATLGGAELRIEIGTAGLPPAVFPAAAARGAASGPRAVTLAAGVAFNGTATVPVAGIAPPPLTAVHLLLSRNGPGAFGGSPLAGTAAFFGEVRLLGFGGLTLAQFPLILGTPLLYGPTGATPPIAVSFTAARWTAGTAAVATGYTGFGGVVTRRGANGLGADGVGDLWLVTPIAVRTSLTGLGNVPVFGTLRLTFVPEPGTLLLLGWGVACLAVAARRRGPPR